MYKFNIGEVVSIIDPGKTYTTNGEKFIEFGFTNAIENRYVPEGRVGVIFARGYHQDGMTELYGINILKNDDPLSLEVEQQVLMSARGIERSTQIQENIPVTKENAVVGLIVKRGKGWDWGNQDGGEGKKGVILKLDVSPSSEHYWVSVKWDSGNSNSYRCGKGSSQPDPEKYDLYIADVDFIVKNNLKYINYAVGNIVKKGVHWCYPDQNKSGLNGKIERIEKDWALVRWDDGSYEMYRIGHEGKYDIQKVI